MVTEDYVSFETAKLLKEKGFDCPSYSHYRLDNGELCRFNTNCSTNLEQNNYVTAPTLQMAMKWLREEKKLYVNVWADPKDVENNDFRTIFRMHVYSGPTNYGASEFFTYEEACEAGIRYCLENLI